MADTMTAAQIHVHVQDKKMAEGYVYFIRYVIRLSGEVLIRPLTGWDKVMELCPSSIHPFAWSGHTVQDSVRYYYDNCWSRFTGWEE